MSPTIPDQTIEAAKPFPSQNNRLLLAWGVLILAVYGCVAMLEAYAAAPWCDEIWLSNPALTYLRHGYFGTPILTEFGWGPPMRLPHIQFRSYWIMPLQMVTQAGWFRVFGYSLISVRCYSIFWGGAAIAALGGVAYLLTKDRYIPLLAMALCGTDYFFVTRAVDGRMDMMACALMLCAALAYLYFRNSSLKAAAAISGLFAACSLFTHPMGGFFSLCILGSLGAAYDRPRIRLIHGFCFSIPFVVFGALWAMYAAQDFNAFRVQLSGNASGRWEGVSDVPASIYREIRFKYLQAYGLNDYRSLTLHDIRLLALATYLLSLVVVCSVPSIRRRPGVRVAAGATLLFMIAGCAFDGAKRWYYLTYVVPLLVLTTAICFRWLWVRKFFPAAVLTWGMALVLIQTGGSIFRIDKNDYRNRFLPAATFALSKDPQHSLIFGAGELGLLNGFPDYVVDDVSLGYFTGRRAQVIFVPEVYWGLWLDDLNRRDPEVGRFVNLLLKNEYSLTFQNSLYRVYERKRVS